MKSPMRWADSDSEGSEEEYNFNEEYRSESFVSETPLNSEPSNNRFDEQSSFSEHQKTDNKNLEHERKNQKRGKQTYSGGKDRKKSHNHSKARTAQAPEEWKQLAKASSRFTSDGNTGTTNIDGSAWMAQRRAKMEQEAKEHKTKEAERLRQEQEAKQTRRKSQMNALKAAMHEIKHEQGDENCQKNRPSIQGGESSESHILNKGSNNSCQKSIGRSDDKEKRVDVHDKHQNSAKGSWRRSKHLSGASNAVSLPQPAPPKYSYTIGQTQPISSLEPKNSFHKVELRPDRSSVKFIRNRGNVACAEQSCSHVVGDGTEKEIHEGNENNREPVIVAFCDERGHPSADNTPETARGQKHRGITRNECHNGDGSKERKVEDDCNEKDEASAKASLSRRLSTFHSSSKSRGGGGGAGKRKGKGNSQRRDLRNSKGGRGRLPQGRESQINSNTKNEVDANEVHVTQNGGEGEKPQSGQNKINERSRGKEGKRRDVEKGRGKGGPSATHSIGKEMSARNEKGKRRNFTVHDNEKSGNRDDLKKGERGRHQASGKDFAVPPKSVPKYSYEIGKN